MTSVQRFSIVTLVKNGKGCVAETGASVRSKKEFVTDNGVPWEWRKVLVKPSAPLWANTQRRMTRRRMSVKRLSRLLVLENGSFRVHDQSLLPQTEALLRCRVTRLSDTLKGLKEIYCAARETGSVLLELGAVFWLSMGTSYDRPSISLYRIVLFPTNTSRSRPAAYFTVSSRSGGV